MIHYSMEPIILASASPRRQDFFRLLGLPFTCIPAEIDETPLPGLSPRQLAEDLARRKTQSVVEKLEQSGTATLEEYNHGVHGVTRSTRKNSVLLRVLRGKKILSKRLLDSASQANTVMPQWVFGADTIVVLEGEIFGKPADRNAAGNMLKRLSGRRHEVISAMALYNGRQRGTDCRSVSCEVDFAPLSEAEIEWYLDTGEWEGVAGSYRLQGLGACFITSINGSPSAVAGLPLRDFYVMLKDNGCQFGASASRQLNFH